MAAPTGAGPVADRFYLSTADGGRGIGDAAEVALWLEGMARRLEGEAPRPAPKNGAQFHFALPGAVQGFMAGGTQGGCDDIVVSGTGSALAVDLVSVGPRRAAYLGTPVFVPPSMIGHTWYEILATPRLWPGQTVSARLSAESGVTGSVDVALAIRHYGQDDALISIVSPESATLEAGQSTTLTWRLPKLDGNPIARGRHRHVRA